MQRRHFLKTAGLVSVCATPLLSSQAFASSREILSDEFVSFGGSVMQGLTDARRTQINVVSPPARSWTYRAYDAINNNDLTIENFQSRNFPGQNSQVDRMEFHGLELGRQYVFEVKNAEGKVIDERNFKSLDLDKKALKFAVASCMSDMFSNVQGEMWDALVKTRPEMLFLIGDLCYTDTFSKTDEAQLWRRFAQSRNQFAVYKMKNLIPTLATWDDHDFGGNNLGREYQFIESSTTNFMTYVAQDVWQNGPLSRGPGVSHCFEAFGLRFQLMDARTFRSQRTATNDNTHWGAAQEEWLLASLDRETRPTFIMNGSQIYGGYMQKDSYEFNHFESLRRITSELRRVSSPVIYVSGDIHASELMRIESEQLGYETFEITSSGIHSFINPFDASYVNPRRLAAKMDFNFTVIEAAAVGPDRVDLGITAYGRNRKVFYTHTASVARG